MCVSVSVSVREGMCEWECERGGDSHLLRDGEWPPAPVHRGTSLIRNSPTLAPYSRPMPRALWWS